MTRRLVPHENKPFLPKPHSVQLEAKKGTVCRRQNARIIPSAYGWLRSSCFITVFSYTSSRLHPRVPIAYVIYIYIFSFDSKLNHPRELFFTFSQFLFIIWVLVYLDFTVPYTPTGRFHFVRSFFKREELLSNGI